MYSFDLGLVFELNPCCIYFFDFFFVNFDLQEFLKLFGLFGRLDRIEEEYISKSGIEIFDL